MNADERIKFLIDFSKGSYKQIAPDEFIKTYEEILSILNTNNEYTTEQKEKLKKEAWLESMAIMYDWFKKFRKELDDIIDWADKEEWKIVENSPIKGLDVNREECKKIHIEMMEKIEKLKEKYNITNDRIRI